MLLQAPIITHLSPQPGQLRLIPTGTGIFDSLTVQRPDRAIQASNRLFQFGQ